MVPPGRYWVAAATMTPVTMMMAPVISKAGKGRVVTGRIPRHPVAGRVIITGTITVVITRTGTTMAGMVSSGMIRGVTIVIIMVITGARA